jgi:hypothetical protein
MRSLSFRGSYQDDAGFERLTWQIRSSRREGYGGRHEISSRIRGIEIWGVDFDGLEPLDPSVIGARHQLHLNTAGELSTCVLTGDLPSTATVAGRTVPIAVVFELDLREQLDRPSHSPKNLRLSTIIDGTSYLVVDDRFEEATLALDRVMGPHRLRCCVTCLYSDYSPGGNGLMGMRCHREVKQQYLRVRSKADYWPVPVTEEVPETYLCEEYEVRIPGTGYRG